MLSRLRAVRLDSGYCPFRATPAGLRRPGPPRWRAPPPALGTAGTGGRRHPRAAARVPGTSARRPGGRQAAGAAGGRLGRGAQETWPACAADDCGNAPRRCREAIRDQGIPAGQKQPRRPGRPVREPCLPASAAGRADPEGHPAAAGQELLLRSRHRVGNAPAGRQGGEPAFSRPPAENHPGGDRLVGFPRIPGAACAERGSAPECLCRRCPAVVADAIGRSAPTRMTWSPILTGMAVPRLPEMPMKFPGGPHLAGHPENQEITHWFDIRGYRNYGATTEYEDSVHGASSIGWSAGVPAYSALSSRTIVYILGARGYDW